MSNKIPIVCNLFAGPGAGKSSLAANVFAELKWFGAKVELVTEVAKDIVWDGHTNLLQNQYLLFGMQLQRQLRLVSHPVDIIITDSPLPFAAVYNKREPAFTQVVINEFNTFNNINYLLQRNKPYMKLGRYQDEDGARALDVEVEDMLKRFEIPYTTIVGAQESVAKVTFELCRAIGLE